MSTSPSYESEKLLNEYLLFHYGNPEEHFTLGEHIDIPGNAMGFAVRSVTGLLPAPPGGRRALDVGCAVGRSSFLLSTGFDEVVGVDYSKSFIAAAEEIRTRGEKTYSRLDEGHRSTPLTARLPCGSRPERVHFEVGDATDLRADLGVFDAVHAANLICRLRDPLRFLRRLPDLVAPGGHLALTTPCTWLGEFTRPDRWPDKPTIEWLGDHLGGAFGLRASCDIPFLIRETARKFQWTVAQGSAWVRR